MSSRRRCLVRDEFTEGGGGEHCKPIAVEQFGGSLASQSLLGGGSGHNVARVCIHTHAEGVKGSRGGSFSAELFHCQGWHGEHIDVERLEGVLTNGVEL